ncbi:hypothetical protein IGI04_035495 [Brassica rapa subsp. trilocularis]|uniref:Dynamin-type G domain-containing protein n=1 Tax=Brassica rapa subsp. trilocularis TaxID=1813537 RepID=A0ABQ7LEK3_BRACM|nr:hypothetical protein IGI04_035495 [Brassica rapa subsp. trilocularis]
MTTSLQTYKTERNLTHQSEEKKKPQRRLLLFPYLQRHLSLLSSRCDPSRSQIAEVDIQLGGKDFVFQLALCMTSPMEGAGKSVVLNSLIGHPVLMAKPSGLERSSKPFKVVRFQLKNKIHELKKLLMILNSNQKEKSQEERDGLNTAEEEVEAKIASVSVHHPQVDVVVVRGGPT